jgi:hypothetical protein
LRPVKSETPDKDKEMTRLSIEQILKSNQIETKSTSINIKPFIKFKPIPPINSPTLPPQQQQKATKL